jgi:hypothetical protein
MAYKFKIEEWRHPSGDTWFRLSVLKGRWPFRHWQRVDSYSSKNQAEAVMKSGLITEPVRLSTFWYDEKGIEDFSW